MCVWYVVFLNCAERRGYGSGCNGGSVSDIFDYLFEYGLPDESCQLYHAMSSLTCTDMDICMNCMPVEGGAGISDFRCWPVLNPVLYYISGYNRITVPLSSLSTNSTFNPSPPSKPSLSQHVNEDAKNNGDNNRTLTKSTRDHVISQQNNNEIHEEKVTETEPLLNQFIMSEIMTRGPVVCSLAASEEFTYTYRSGMYISVIKAIRDIRI